MEEFLECGANHAIEKHGMRSEDVYVNDVPANLLCHHLLKKPTTKGRRPYKTFRKATPIKKD